MKAQVEERRRPDQKNDDGRHGQDVDGVRLPVQPPAHQEKPHHDRSPDHRRSEVRYEGVEDKNAQRAGNDNVLRQSHDKQQRVDHQRNQADVQSGYGQDMGQADRRESVEKFIGQLPPLAQEDSLEQGGGIAPHGPVDRTIDTVSDGINDGRL